MDPATKQHLINLAYLAAGVLFILGLKGLTHPRTAVRGNLLGAAGMLLAVLATLFHNEILGFWWIAGGVVIGAAIGATLAVKIEMTAMPQLVALFNGFGGGASVLVAWSEYIKAGDEPLGDVAAVAIVVSVLIGAVTLLGSLVAFGKLQELQMFKKPLRFPGQQLANAGLAGASMLLRARGRS